MLDRLRALLTQPIGSATAFQIIGYYPHWSALEPAEIPFDKLTHVIFSFVNPTPAGGLVDVHFNRMAQVANAARAHGVRVSLAVGGWQLGETRDWEMMASNPHSLGKFIRNIGNLCDSYGLDGVDIDWEYPTSPFETAYLNMMLGLADTLHAKGRLLSAAVAVEPRHGVHIREEVLKVVDFLNIKAYDGNVSHPERPHSSYEYAEAGLKYWLKRGCPRKKAMLGVPFYGRSPVKTYRELVERDFGAAYRDRAGSVHYNGIPTIEKKTELALRKGGGIMIWELSQDSSDHASLLTAICNKAGARAAARKAVP